MNDLFTGTNSASQEATSSHPYSFLESATLSVSGLPYGLWVTLDVQAMVRPWKEWYFSSHSALMCPCPDF